MFVVSVPILNHSALLPLEFLSATNYHTIKRLSLFGNYEYSATPIMFVEGCRENEDLYFIVCEMPFKLNQSKMVSLVYLILILDFRYHLI
jgi:hypothetical protein